MSSTTINFPPLRGSAKIADEEGNLDPDAHIHLLAPFNGHPLQTVDTSGGNASFAVPLAKANQNKEITFVKISADVNTPTLVPNPNGNDKFNSVGAWAAASFVMGTAQGSKVRLRSDGVSNWYVVG